MSKPEFVDYYEVLEVSPKANSYTIERIFRFLAKRFHPDVAESGDVHRFSLIAEAYNTLRDPKLRAAYDVEFDAQKQLAAGLVKEAKCAGSDTDDRDTLLTLFYAQRRRNMKQPGVGIATLEQAIDCPAEIVEFHLWYFREKNWIKREDSGLLAITASGVERVEDSVRRSAESNVRKITEGAARIQHDPTRGQVPVAV